MTVPFASCIKVFNATSEINVRFGHWVVDLPPAPPELVSSLYNLTHGGIDTVEGLIQVINYVSCCVEVEG